MEIRFMENQSKTDRGRGTSDPQRSALNEADDSSRQIDSRR